MLMTYKDLKKVIPDFIQFTEFILKFREIVDTGKLAEFYCSKLFELKLVKPHNSSFDALSTSGEKIEIKHRFFSNKIPPGMEIELQNIDYVLYVELNNNLLPKRIFKIKANDIEYTKGKRVSFNRAFKGKKAELLFGS